MKKIPQKASSVKETQIVRGFVNLGTVYARGTKEPEATGRIKCGLA